MAVAPTSKRETRMALSLHLFWRWKTTGWTEPWGGWNDVDTADREEP